MSDEYAKAVQEVAKTANTALEITDKTAGGLMQELCGMATDRVQFWRAKQWLSIQDKWREIHRQRGIEGKTVPMSPKLAVQIMDAASLEEDETLQGLWARLIANALDPTYIENIRPAHIAIIKELEPDEAVILNVFSQCKDYPYLFSRKRITGDEEERYRALRERYATYCSGLPLKYPGKALQYLDNLLRTLLVTYAINDAPPVTKLDLRLIDGGTFEGPKTDDAHNKVLVEIPTEESLKVTDLGMAFIDACIRVTKPQY